MADQKTFIKSQGNKPITDIRGMAFGRWTVIGYAGKSGLKHYWECRCKCGTVKKVLRSNLFAGISKSCGCHKKEILHHLKAKHYAASGSKTTEYRTWVAMKRRCYSPNSTGFKYWGGRGIHVCDQWLKSFEAFLSDMGKKPSPKHSLDRINNDGNYEPSNCRWATNTEQRNNTRRTNK